MPPGKSSYKGKRSFSKNKDTRSKSAPSSYGRKPQGEEEKWNRKEKHEFYGERKSPRSSRFSDKGKSATSSPERNKPGRPPFSPAKPNSRYSPKPPSKFDDQRKPGRAYNDRDKGERK